MKTVVITGGIGSGKSWACRYLSETFGWPVYDADTRVKELYGKSQILLPSIEKRLGRSFRDESGIFCPAKLASVIFSDINSLNIVESLVFPELMADFEKWREENSGYSCVILESATILEKPALSGVGDVVVLIDAPVPLRAARASARDEVALAHVYDRIACQKLMNDFSEGVKKPDVDFVIFNTSTQEAFAASLRKVAEEIM